MNSENNFRLVLCRHRATLKLASLLIAPTSRFNLEVNVGSTWIKSSLEVQATINALQTLAVNFHLVLKYITKHVQPEIHFNYRREQWTPKIISELHYVYAHDTRSTASLLPICALLNMFTSFNLPVLPCVAWVFPACSGRSTSARRPPSVAKCHRVVSIFIYNLNSRRTIFT